MDELDKILDSVKQMPQPFGVSGDQWAQIQGAAAAFEAWKLDVTTKVTDLEARVAALEAASKPMVGVADRA